MVQNRPDSPHQPTSTGDSTSETAKDRPIEPPTMAMARVRTSSRVASASQAVTAAEMAPAPWMARPMVIQNTSDAWAQTTLPATNNKAGDHHGPAAPAVGRQPEGNLHEGLGQAVHAQRQAHAGRIVAAGQAARRHREDRQQQEQPQHARREQSRQRHAGAALGRGQFQFGFCRHADYWTVMASKRPLGKPGGPTLNAGLLGAL